jgi:GntR family transcriptional regulator/MocR family aminotransferase
MPLVALDRASSEALHIQIYRQIAAVIADHENAHGRRLPSTRMWSKLLRVSRNTVMAAYEELAAQGLIRGSHGSGMFVRARQKRPGNLLRAAHFPERTAPLPDPDGNPLYVNF